MSVADDIAPGVRAGWIEAAEAAGEFVSVRLPLFLAWFACAVVILLVGFVVWMSFVSGVPT